MRYQLRVRHGGKIIIVDENLVSIKEIRIGEVMDLSSYFPDKFPNANYGKCIDRGYVKVASVETCIVELETAYK